jgi:hypothetical protein
MAETPTRAEAILGAIEAAVMDMHVSAIGRIHSYDASTQRAEVQLQLQHMTPDGEGGFVPTDFPILPNVPVAFPQGNGFFISFPLVKGDPVLVVFNDLPIGTWLQKGSKCEPGVVRFHGLGGAVAYAGLQPTQSPIADASDTDMMLGKDGTTGSQIKLTGTQVHLGGGANFVALANLVMSRLNTLQVAHDTHNHATAPVGPVSVPSVIVGALADVAATNVKAT